MEKLGIFEADPDSFLERFLMVDEVWVKHYQPNMKDQYYFWKSLGSGASPRPDEHYVHTRAYSAGPFMAGQLFAGTPLQITIKLDSGRTFLFAFTH